MIVKIQIRHQLNEHINEFNDSGFFKVGHGRAKVIACLDRHPTSKILTSKILNIGILS
jgi:hypothetical protein